MATIKPTILIDDLTDERGWTVVGRQQQDVEGSFFRVTGFHVVREEPVLEKPTDAIPNQSVFVKEVNIWLAYIGRLSSGKEKAIIDFFRFLLSPQYAAFHTHYQSWRLSVHERCQIFLAQGVGAGLASLCNRFMQMFPA